MPNDPDKQEELKKASIPTATVNAEAASTAAAMAVQPPTPQMKSPTPQMTNPMIVNPPPNTTPPTFPNSTQVTPILQTVPATQLVPNLIPRDAGQMLLMTDLGTKKGSKIFETWTDTKGVVYEVGVKQGKEIKRNLEKWVLMHNMGPFITIPMGGSGAPSASSSSTSPVPGYDLCDPRNLVTHTHLCDKGAFESSIRFIFDGSNSMRGANTQMEIGQIDPNSGAHMNLDRWKRQMRMMSHVLLHYLHALIKPTDFDALLVNMDSFLFKDQTSKVHQMCGFLVLYEILQICSPSTLIDVEALEKTFNETTLLSAKGDFVGFVTELTRLRQKINIEMNTNHCTEQKYAIQFFRGALAWPNIEWRSTVKTKNQEFLLGDGIPVPDLIPKLSKIVNNMKAEKTWTVNDVDDTRKDVVLATILKKQKNLEKKLEATTTQKKVSLTTDGGDKKKVSAWRYKKTSHYSNNPVTGEKHVWCDDHGSGCYMPHPHDHSAWKKRKEEKQAERESYKKARRGQRDANPKPKKEDKDDSDKSSRPTTLQLKDSIKSVLVTDAFASQADAERMSDLILTKADF